MLMRRRAFDALPLAAMGRISGPSWPESGPIALLSLRSIIERAISCFTSLNRLDEAAARNFVNGGNHHLERVAIDKTNKR